MSIAYSRQTITRALLRADTSAHFRADMDAALLASGWLIARSVTNGKVYETQGAPHSALKMRLLVQDQGTGSGAGQWIIFQPMTADELGAGIAHTILVAGNYSQYQAIVGCCQLFLSVSAAVGPVIGDQSYAFACGVPSLPLNTPTAVCLVGIPPPGVVTDIWWACGPGNQAFFACPDWRTQPRCFGCFDYSYNGAVISVNSSSGANQDPAQGMLGLFYLCATANTDYPTYVGVQGTTYGAETPLYIDAIMGWLWQIRGQLWDAFQQTNQQVLDNIATYYDTDIYNRQFSFPAQAWMVSYYCTLRLLTRNPFGAEAGYIY